VADFLILGATSDAHQGFLTWRERHHELHDFVPDYHRLQLEYWIHANRARLQGKVMDIGVQNPRRWLGNGYFTLGHTADTHSDRIGDVTALPFEDEELDAIVCTEVLEHCADPFKGVDEMHRVLKTGGLLLVTSPFIWPWHGTANYPDYWRFTDQGWRHLLRAFSSVKVEPTQWTPEGEKLLDLVRRFEGWGFLSDVYCHTGYLCEAIK
jgi:SAM-dependent methyltransferase